MDTATIMRATAIATKPEYKILYEDTTLEDLQIELEDAWKDLEGNVDIFNDPDPCPIDDEREWEIFNDYHPVYMEFVIEGLNEQLSEKFGETFTFFSRGYNGETLYPNELSGGSAYTVIDLAGNEDLEDFNNFEDFLDYVANLFPWYRGDYKKIASRIDLLVDEMKNAIEDAREKIKIIKFIDKYLRAESSSTWEWWAEKKQQLKYEDLWPFKHCGYCGDIFYEDDLSEDKLNNQPLCYDCQAELAEVLDRPEKVSNGFIYNQKGLPLTNIPDGGKLTGFFKKDIYGCWWECITVNNIKRWIIGEYPEQLTEA